MWLPQALTRRRGSSSSPSSTVILYSSARGPATILFSVLLYTGLFAATSQRPLLHDTEGQKLTKAMMYLMRYGYMDHINPMSDSSGGKSASLVSFADSMHQSIMEFQRFAGLNETGIMDEETEKMMQMPRCGVKDVPNDLQGGAHRRQKRYLLQGSRWRVKNLTYKISSYPRPSRRLSRRDVDSEIERALKVWSEYTDLTFEKSDEEKVHIDIKFEEGEHGDGDPFDGKGGTLAHAFFPVFGGDAHFDLEETWTKGTPSGTNLLQTAAHEFGHSLGLSHSDKNSALMAPFYRGYQARVKLASDDIEAIQELYGEKQRRRPTTTTSRPRTRFGNNDGDSRPKTRFFDDDDDDNETAFDRNDDNELCRDASLDVIVTTKDETTYTFKGSQYWKLTDESVADGYPRRISRDWEGLPSNLDAAFTWTNGKTYFFKGHRYWRYTNQERDSGYPKDISKGFEGIPDDVDAAFRWTGNDKIYFFKGTKYYKFDPMQNPPVSERYPKPISNWIGIPNNIDDALQYSNGYTYFFKDGQYWRFNDREFDVDEAEPEFPRPASYWWFGCSKQDLSMKFPSGNRGGKQLLKSHSSSSATIVPRLTTTHYAVIIFFFGIIR